MLDLQEEASNTLAKDQFRKKAEDVAMPRILWALGAATSLELAPECTRTSRNKKNHYSTLREKNYKTTQRASEACQQSATSSLRTLIGSGQDIIAVRQVSRPRKQRETEWQRAWQGAHRSLSVRQKTPEPTK